MADQQMIVSATQMAWLMGDDVGLSSKAIWCRMTGSPSREDWHPLDPSDFGRCYRLLLRFPEWRPRIGEMADVSPTWAALVARWDELTALYEEEVGVGLTAHHLRGARAPKLYDVMQTIRQEARDNG